MTDPTPQTTPTRDEAVPADVLAQTERRENGLRANMDEVATLAHQMVSIIRRGALRPDPKTGWLEPASAPAPASGVDAVAVKALRWVKSRSCKDDRQADTDLGQYCVGLVHGSYVALRRHIRDGQLHDDVLARGLGFEDAKAACQSDYEQRVRSALSPAATPVSEAGGMVPLGAEFEKVWDGNARELYEAAPALSPSTSAAEPVALTAHDHRLLSKALDASTTHLYDIEPAPAAVDGQRVKDGRPEGWTEALAISFMAANGHNPEMGMFAKSFNEGAWREIKTEWPEFIEFAGARIRPSLASTDATEETDG